MTEAMNCSDLRERLNQDPSSPNEAFERHASACPACRAYLARLLRAETLIGRALRFDTAAIGSRTPSAAMPLLGSRWISLAAGFAACVLAGLTLFGLHLSRAELDPAELALAVTDHWDHEPGSWARTDFAVPADLLGQVLAGTARLDRSRLETVSFARSCLIGGRRVPHLVVQGERGPYMIVLFADRRLETAVPLELASEGLAGHLLPVGAGSIAVLGAPTEELERMERTVSAAFEWTI